MKKFILTFFVSLLIIFTYADSWRSGEQQVKIQLNNPEQVVFLREFKIDYEPCGLNMVRAYLIPKERLKLELMGFEILTEIEDLNKHFENFWLTEDSYHTYQQIIDLADSLEEHFPLICKKYIVGTSLGGRQLAALKISDNVLIDEPEPEVFFDGGIHGDEIGGSENIIRFARDLCLGYGSNPTITDLINNRETWLYLMVNPDGRVNMVRYNNNGADLNRDCGYMWDQDGSTYGLFEEVESRVLRSINLENQFVIYTSYHSGTEFLSFPWSYRPDATTDFAHINQLAQIYVNQSGYTNLPYGAGYAGMYPINGSTKDAYYGITGSVSWSIEISMSKQPPASQIMTYYNNNKPSMLALIQNAGYGLQGMVTDASTGEPVAAIVFVNNYYPCYSDPEVGDYHKYVLPGTYTITVKANGYQSQTISNVVVTANNATAADFQMVPEDGHYGYKFVASRIPGNNFYDEGNTPASLGPPDNINYSLGKSGYCMIDMQYPVIDSPGPDLIVYEGDASPESFTCFGGSTIDGPWISLGAGTGTTEFDLAGSGLTEAQYIKLIDDGDGTANAANAGFDLDAIKAMAPVSGVYLVMTEYSIDDANGNNNGMIDPGETVDVYITVKNNGDIPAADIIGSISSASPFISITTSTANFGTLPQGQSSTGAFTLMVDEATPVGESFSINFNIEANGGTYTNSFLMSFSVGLILEDWETGDFSQFEWETGGDNNWTITNVSPYEGVYSAKSGSISNSQSSYLSITYNVLANGEISFFKKVSSEAGYDFLSFYIDNALQEQWSGEVAWSESSFPVTSGQHTFKWEYFKDVSVASGSDCGWLDYIILPSGAIQGLVPFFTANQTNVCEGDNVNFTDYSSGNITSWNWSFPGGTPSVSSQQNPTITYSTVGTYNVTLTISNGSDSQTIMQEDYINVAAIPEIPQIPDGNEYPFSIPGFEYEYTATPVAFAESYEWVAEPLDAIETIVSNGTNCIIDFTDYWGGEVTLKVKAMNDCGESEFSDELLLYVMWEVMQETHQNSLIISPNPSDGLVSINLGDISDDQVEIRVLNNLGKVVFNENISVDNNGASFDLDLRKVEPGIYFIVIVEKQITLTEKMIVR
jgi:PKD repeat protein